MEPIAVVPRYRLSTKPWVIAALVVFPGLTLLSRLPWFLLLMIPFLLLLAAAWYGRIRSIVFDDAVRVRRVRGRERVYAYRDVRAITPTAIRMRRGAISLMEPLGQGTFQNADEVTTMFRALVEAGVIPEAGMIPAAELAAERRRVVRSLVPAALLSLGIALYGVASGRLSGGLFAELLPLLIFAALFALFYLLQRRFGR
jgi:hypothetical protein